MGASVQIRVDVWGDDGKPHTFLRVTRPDGSIREYGLVPDRGSRGRIDITGPGTVTGEHEFNFSGDERSLTPDQYQDLKDFIDHAIIDPPDYSLPGPHVAPGSGANNCTSWAHDALNSCGQSDLDPNGDPSIPSPYGQAIHYGGDDIMNFIRDLFHSGEAAGYSPLILDLDGDGVETTGVMTGTYFDHSGDGFAEQTGWVGADDGLLVYDRNGNGLIDSGVELFGVASQIS